MLERKVDKGKLVILRTGTIYIDLGNIRGVNPLDIHESSKNNLKATRVKYVSHDEIPAKELFNSFIFYNNLPLDIEGNQFSFVEEYPEESEKDIPLRQELRVFGNDKHRLFGFNNPTTHHQNI